MKTIKSEVLGELNQSENFHDLWHGPPKNIPLINKKLKVTFMDFEPSSDDLFIQEADNALRSFLHLDSTCKNKIARIVFGYFKEFQIAVGEDIPKEMNGVSEAEIWDFITPTELLVARRPYNKPDIFINMICECSWDPEHGLQLVFKKGKALTRVSTQDGHLTTADADDIPDSEDDLLSKYEE